LSTAQLFPNSQGEVKPNSESTANFEPLELLDSRRKNSEIFSTALSELQTLKKAPACHRIAARVLLNDCQRLEENDSFDPNVTAYEDEDRLMDYTYSYALSLAMCDLGVARQKIPESCTLFQESTLLGLSTRDKRKGIHVSHEQIQACVSSLYLDNNSWTSFSNNKGKATLFCQASRIDIQKGGLLGPFPLLYWLMCARSNYCPP
jgi:hypothetical protein